MSAYSGCETTHRQIRFGPCPWCKLALLEGQPAQQSAKEPFEGRWWDIPRMLADLENGDDQTRLDTATNLVEHPPAVDDALRLLRKALDDPLPRVNELAEKALCRLSKALSVDDLPRYEARIKEDPSDLATLTIVLWVYFSARSRSEAIQASWQRLVLWVIEAKPRARVAGMPLVSSCWGGDFLDKAKRLWLSHVELNPRDAPADRQRSQVLCSLR